MEDAFRTTADYVALAAEACSVVCIVIGMAKAVFHGLRYAGRRWPEARAMRREIFVRFGSWIVLSLEFALAADIVRTAIAPTWDDIGRLGAIAVIRTFLNWFLERDLEAVQDKPTETRGEPA